MDNVQREIMQGNDELLKKAAICIKAHKAAYEHWPHGKAQGFFETEDGKILIQYQSDKWWNYRITDSGDVEWW